MRVRIVSPTVLVTRGNWVIWNSKDNHEWRGNYYYTHHWHSFFHTYIVIMATVSTKCVFTRNIRYHSVVLLNIETGKCYSIAIIHDHDSCPCQKKLSESIISQGQFTCRIMAPSLNAVRSGSSWMLAAAQPSFSCWRRLLHGTTDTASSVASQSSSWKAVAVHMDNQKWNHRISYDVRNSLSHLEPMAIGSPLQILQCWLRTNKRPRALCVQLWAPFQLANYISLLFCTFHR